MLRIRPARWAAILLTAFALMTPAFGLSGNSTQSVVADAPATPSAPAPGDMIWG